MPFLYTHEELRELEEGVLRSLMREAAHHGVETRLYPSLNGKKDPFEIPDKLRKLLQVYEEKGYDMQKADIQWVKEVVRLAEQWNGGKKPEIKGHKPESNEENLLIGTKLIYGRRSIRQWTEEPVVKQMLEEIIKAGTFAPCACLVQGVRYIVIDDSEDLKNVKSREFDGETAKIITLVDKRPFAILSHIPKKNLLLDVGAAMQNMLLMAEALGLGAVWGTLNDTEIEIISSYFKIPDYYEIVAYISLGHADETVLTPGRISPEEAIIRWNSDRA